MAFCDVDVLKVATAARTQLPCPPAEDEVVVFVIVFGFLVFGFFIFGFVVHLGTLEWKGLLGNENLRVVSHSVQFSRSVGQFSQSIGQSTYRSFFLSSEMIAGLG